MESIHSSFRFDLKKEGGGPLRRIGPFKVQPLLPALHKKRPGRVFRGRGHIARETVSRVLFLTVIYLDGPSPGRSSHPGSGRASLGAEAPAPIPVLLRIEFTAMGALTHHRVSSYLAFPPFPRRRKRQQGGISLLHFS